MAIDSVTARRNFIDKKEEEIDEYLRNHDGLTTEIFLGSALNVSEEAMKELKESYEKQGWKVSFEKKLCPDIFVLFSKDRDLYIILTR